MRYDRGPECGFVRVRLQVLKENLGPSCRAAFTGLPVHPSASDVRVNAKGSKGAAAGWVVEVNGPSHFLTCRLPVGGTLMKRRHLALLGYTVVSLPFWEWNKLTGSDERKEYLRGKLHIS